MIASTPLDFIVLAYPRSGTTWLANWLTTDRSLCLHDPFSHGMPDVWPVDGRIRGISCTGSYLLGDWLAQYTCPVVILERDRADCDASLHAVGLGAFASAASTERLDTMAAYRFAFDDLWHEDTARALWAYLLPTIPFDAIRYRLLRDMQVQPVPAALIPTDGMVNTMRRVLAEV